MKLKNWCLSNSFVKLSLLVFVTVLGLLPSVAFGQEELSETFTAEDSSFTFDYPDGWEVEVDEETGVATLTLEDTSVTLYSPAVLAAQFELENPANEAEALELFIEATDAELNGDIIKVELGERVAARASLTTSDDTATVAFAVEFEEEAGFGVIVLNAPAETLEEAEATAALIAETFNVPSSSPFGNLTDINVPTVLCTVSTDQERFASVRVGPGENRTAIVFLPTGQEFNVLGQAAADDGSMWWKLDKAEVAPQKAANEVWVAQDQVTENGDCELVADATAPPIVPIIVAPPAADTGGGETTTEVTGGIVPNGGTWQMTSGSSVSISCGGQSFSSPMDVISDSVFVSVAADGSSIAVDGDVLSRAQPSVYSGEFPVPFDDQVVFARLTLEATSPNAMQGTISLSLEGCLAAIGVTLTHR